MGFGALFVASLLPVIKVFIMCSVGAVTSSMGLLTVEARRVISGLIFNVFVPCLFLDHLGAGEGFLNAIKLWPLTFNMVATHVLGGVLGALLVLVVRPPLGVRKHMVVATMIGNTGNLPLVLIASLGDDPALAWLGGSALGIQYVILGNFSAAFFQFPITTALLRKPDPGDAATDAAPVAEQQGVAGSTSGAPEAGQPPEEGEAERSRLLGPSPPPAAAPSSSGSGTATPGGLDALVAREGSAPLGPGGHERLGGHYQQQQQQQQEEQEMASVPLLNLRPAEARDGGSGAALTVAAEEQPSSSGAGGGWAWRARQWWQEQRARWRARAKVPPMPLEQRWKQLQPIMSGIVSPPTIACVVALTVATIKPLQALFYGGEAPLRLVSETLAMLGDLTIPCLMLVLGANLAKGPGAGKGMPLRCVAATCVCRLVLLPLAGTGLVLAMRAGGMLNDLQPIGVISMLLTHAVPTAIMVHSMSVMYMNAPDEVAALLFYEYLASAVTVPCMLAFFLHLVGEPAS